MIDGCALTAIRVVYVLVQIKWLQFEIILFFAPRGKRLLKVDFEKRVTGTEPSLEPCSRFRNRWDGIQSCGLASRRCD